ncbi:MAG: OmpW/AlkL family protein [Janthinobacterium lividum]
MKSIIITALAAAILAGGVAQAQTAAGAADVPVGKQAGTVMVRVRAIGVLPQNSSSSVSGIGGSVAVTNTPAPEIDLSYFFTDSIAVEGIAASTRHDVSATHTALGHVDVGSVWVLPPTVTLQYHFMPRQRFSPYLGAGMTAAFFYDSSPANPTVTKVGFSNNVGAAIQAGFDYNISGHWFANFDVKQIFLNTTARINGGAIIAKTALNPTIVGAGIGYRF